SVAVKDGRIEAVGTWKELENLENVHTKVIDLDGKTVVPGFIDAHQHIVSFGFNLLNVNCRVSSIKEMVHAIEERSKTLEPDEWIIGFGFDEANYVEGRLPHKDDFSHIKNPIYITRFCLHSAIVNDRALELAGVTEETEYGSDGEIDKDKQGVTGILREGAMDLVRKIIPPYNIAQIKKAIKLASNHYIKEGITGVHEAGMGFFTDSLEEFTALKEMSANNDIDVRIYGMILEKFWDQLQEQNLLTDVENDFFKIGSIKLFSDGALSSQTAAVMNDYVEPAGTKGLFMYEKEELEAKVLRAHKAGKQLAIHAIGDAAVDVVTGAYEKAIAAYPREDHRHRIEHCGIVNEQLLDRIEKANVIPVPHPGIVFVAGDVYKKVLAPEVLIGLYNTKTFIERGLQPAFSSDNPVVPSAPLYNIYAAITRETSSRDVIVEEQKISIYDAVKMYTKNAARAAFNEMEQGTICPGKYADFVVLPEDFMNFSPKQVKDAEIEMTIVNGKIKFSK
ncbi:MAG TPA: amidohydrolase, partial [Pseudogracilibacillus sp.]|nr:amidohydrolase [Pseudogracilibacillus sp.]